MKLLFKIKKYKKKIWCLIGHLRRMTLSFKMQKILEIVFGVQLTARVTRHSLFQ